jgi:hypothetical protein
MHHMLRTLAIVMLLLPHTGWAIQAPPSAVQPPVTVLHGQVSRPNGAPVRGANVDNSRMLPNLDGTRATVQARSIRSQTANVNGFGARGGGNTSQLQAYGSSYRAPTTLRPGGAY